MKKICLDPGHSAADSGAVGPLGTQEKNLNLQIAKALAIKLAKNGYEPFLTRIDDHATSLNARRTYAEENKVDALLSIHCNASINPNASGIETVYGNIRPIGSKMFAESIQNAMMLGNHEHKDRGTKASPSPEYMRDIYIVKNIDAKIPAALIEVEFISNSAMEKWIIESIDHIAECLFNGIDSYFEQ